MTPNMTSAGYNNSFYFASASASSPTSIHGWEKRGVSGSTSASASGSYSASTSTSGSSRGTGVGKRTRVEVRRGGGEGSISSLGSSSEEESQGEEGDELDEEILSDHQHSRPALAFDSEERRKGASSGTKGRYQTTPTTTTTTTTTAPSSTTTTTTIKRPSRSRTRQERPPRIAELFLRLPNQTTQTSSTSLHPSQKKRRRICTEPNCCQRGLRERDWPSVKEEKGDEEGGHGGSSGSSRREQTSGAGVSEETFQDLFWRRQMWIMEHRDADGESHCSEEEGEDEGDEVEVQKEGRGGGGGGGDPAKMEGHSELHLSSREKEKRRERTPHHDVLRTAGAGLPLARVKRAMKTADGEIKMISHESPSLLSRLCTVLIADLSVRAGRNALVNGRRTITCDDLRDITVGPGEGAGDQWEFLRDCVEGEDL